MIVLAQPEPRDMVLAVKKAINMLPAVDPHAMHERVSFLSPLLELCLDKLGQLLNFDICFFQFVYFV